MLWVPRDVYSLLFFFPSGFKGSLFLLPFFFHSFYSSSLSGLPSDLPITYLVYFFPFFSIHELITSLPSSIQAVSVLWICHRSWTAYSGQQVQTELMSSWNLLLEVMQWSHTHSLLHFLLRPRNKDRQIR